MPSNNFLPIFKYEEFLSKSLKKYHDHPVIIPHTRTFNNTMVFLMEHFSLWSTLVTLNQVRGSKL